MAAATITTSIVTGGTNSHATTSEEANAYATDFVAQGIVGVITNTSGVAPATGGFAVNADGTPDMGVAITAGVAYILATPASQNSQVLRARMTSNYTAYTINANSSGTTKYDWIYLQVNATNAGNPDAGADNVATLLTSRSTSINTDTGSPPTYGILLAVVTVANGATSITNATIADRRIVATLSNGNQNSTNGWSILGYALSYGANNGNKEFTVTTPNDLTGLLNPGMRFKTTRSITPPSRCMAFVASSSQYASKSSPSGISFTTAFTAEAWIRLNSYQGADQDIISRDDGSNGWGLYAINATGQLACFYRNGSNTTVCMTSASLPLQRWVHVAAVVSSTSSKTVAMYINGSLAASSVSGSATSLVQGTGNLQIGKHNSTTYFDGYVSEARVWSVAQSLSSIQSNMATNLVGNEPNLVALYQGNGNFNDATSNGNNLTAQAGAIATQAANPYNVTEYAFITKVSYSNPTTTITLFTGTDSNIPNMTLSNPYYSTQVSPFGFNTDKSKWTVDSIYIAQLSQSSTTGGTFYNLGTAQLSVPTGPFRIGYAGTLYAFKSGASNTGLVGPIMSLSAGSSTPLTIKLTGQQYMGASGAANAEISQKQVADDVYAMTSQLMVYMNVKSANSIDQIAWQSSTVNGASLIISAQSAYA